MESRASPQNNLVIWTIPFFFLILFLMAASTCARGRPSASILCPSFGRKLPYK